MVSLTACIKEMADWGFSPEYIVKEYLKWVPAPFCVFLQRFNNIKQELNMQCFAVVNVEIKNIHSMLNDGSML